MTRQYSSLGLSPIFNLYTFSMQKNFSHHQFVTSYSKLVPNLESEDAREYPLPFYVPKCVFDISRNCKYILSFLGINKEDYVVGVSHTFLSENAFLSLTERLAGIQNLIDKYYLIFLLNKETHQFHSMSFHGKSTKNTNVSPSRILERSKFNVSKSTRDRGNNNSLATSFSALRNDAENDRDNSNDSGGKTDSNFTQLQTKNSDETTNNFSKTSFYTMPESGEANTEEEVHEKQNKY